MTQKISSHISNQIWVIKIIAIFTIFFAHMPVSDLTISISEDYSWLVRLFSLLGMVGVPTFFVVSGYLFKPGRIVHRAKGLLIPLIIWGCVTYSLHCLKEGFSTFNFEGLILWTLGVNCYLYFVPVLFLITLLYNIYDNDYIWIIIGLFCVWLYQTHLLKYTGVFTPYVNPLNFIPYFAIGHLVRRFDIWEKLQSNLTIIASIAIITILYISKDFYVHVWYFDLLSFIANLTFAMLMIAITKGIKQLPDSIVTFGKCTFVIYLCHMPIATTLNKLLSRYLEGYYEPIKILIAIIIVSIITELGYVILSKLHWHKLMTYIGYRK